MNISMEQFLHSCIAAGCDYLKNVRGIGIHKAFQLYMQEPPIDVFAELSKRGAPHDYKDKFLMTKSVFLHQTVFDPIGLKTRQIHEWLTPPSQELQHYCGVYPFMLTKKYIAMT
jgi:exonuclease-1